MAIARAAGIVVVLLILACQPRAPAPSSAKSGSSTGVAPATPSFPSATTVVLTVGGQGTGTGRILSTPAGIDCPGSCSLSLLPGTPFDLFEQADDASRFTGWSGDCEGPSIWCMGGAANLTVYATFESNARPPAPPPAACLGLSPDIAGPPTSLGAFTTGDCAPAIGDAQGTLGLPGYNSTNGGVGLILYLVDEENGRQKNALYYSVSRGTFLAQPDGVIGIFHEANAFTALHWDHGGVFRPPSLAPQPVLGDGTFVAAPLGGAIGAGDFYWDGAPPGLHHAAIQLNDHATLGWRQELAAAGAVVGVGADSFNRALIITQGAGAITAQWLDGDGTPLTGEFELIAGFQPGANTWFETAQLIGGGLAVRRVDQQDDVDGRPYRTAQWLVTVASGRPGAQPAPQWMKDRPNTNLAVARSGRAYAALPMGAPRTRCAQKIEVLAPDGTPCGSFDATISRGLCRTEDVALGKDDTPIQLLPRNLTPPSTCKYRWWPRALH